MTGRLATPTSLALPAQSYAESLPGAVTPVICPRAETVAAACGDPVCQLGSCISVTLGDAINYPAVSPACPVTPVGCRKYSDGEKLTLVKRMAKIAGHYARAKAFTTLPDTIPAVSTTAPGRASNGARMSPASAAMPTMPNALGDNREHTHAQHDTYLVAMLSQILASPKLMDKAFYWAIGLALEFTSQRAVMKAVCMDMPAVAVTSNDEFIGELEKRAALYVEAFVKIVGSSSFVDMKLKAASNATAEQVTNRAAMTSTSTSASGSHSKAD